MILSVIVTRSPSIDLPKDWEVPFLKELSSSSVPQLKKELSSSYTPFLPDELVPFQVPFKSFYNSRKN